MYFIFAIYSTLKDRAHIMVTYSIIITCHSKNVFHKIYTMRVMVD